MADRLLLDTNAASSGMRMDSAAVAVFGAAEAVYLSSVALGELYYGAFHAASASAQLARVQQLEANSSVISADSATAQVYGRIKAELRTRGRMIPDNDIWIAALAMQHDLVVMTRDAHFAEVSGLPTVGWQRESEFKPARATSSSVSATSARTRTARRAARSSTAP